MSTQRTLLEFRRSPNAIKARIGLKHKELEFEPREMSAEDRRPVVEASGWPLIPVLIDGEVVMRDSEAILHYLECNYRDRPGLSLTDREAVREADAVKKEFLQGFRPLAVEAFGEMQKPEEERDGERLSALNDRVQEVLEPLEERLQSGTHLFGDRLTMWDVIIGCSLIPVRAPTRFIDQSPMWEFFSRHFAISEGLPELRRWYDDLIVIDGLAAE